MNFVSILLGTTLLASSVLSDEYCYNEDLFENFEDITCKSYIDCQFGKHIILKCPPATQFDPIRKQCTGDYKCEHTPLNCTQPGNFKHPNDAFCQHYLHCEVAASNDLVPTTVPCPIKFHFNPLTGDCCDTYVCESPYLRKDVIDCSHQEEGGPFNNPLDKTCTTYYYCVLNKFNQLVSSVKSCSPSYYFDPAKQKCTTSYQCEWTLDQITIQEMCRDKDFEQPYADQSDKTCKTFYFCINDLNNTRIRKNVCNGSSLFDPTTNSCSENYVCTSPDNEVLNAQDCIGKSKGPHMEEGDPTCKKYYFCMRNNRKVTYECNDDLLFDSSNKVCSGKTTCNSDLSISDDDFVDELCTGKDNGPHSYLKDPNCNWYYFCTKHKSGYYFHKESCGDSMVFDPNEKVCTTNYRCPTKKYQDDVDCIGKGKGPFADVSDLSSKTYYFCQSTVDGLKKEMFTCNGLLMFDPERKICTTNFKNKFLNFEFSGETKFGIMPERQVGETIIKEMRNIDDISESSGSSDSSQSRELIAEEKEANILCEGKNKGPHANETDTTCKAYYFCHGGGEQAYVLFADVCPDNLLFNPEKKTCTTAYICPFDKNAKSDPECVGKEIGPHRDELDETCTGYYFCIKHPNGLIIRDSAKCEDPLMYSPEFKACSSIFVCPFKEDDTILINSLENSSQEDDEEEYDYIDEELRAESIARCRGKDNGPHPFSEDKECQTYYTCEKIKDDYYKVENYTCDKKLLFDPRKRMCTNVYLCPTGANLHVNKDCVDKGKGPHGVENDVQCVKYYTCREKKNGFVVKKEATCKSPYMFDPKKKVCTKTFNCRYKRPEVISVTRPKVKEVTVDTMMPPEDFLKNTKLCSGKKRGPHEVVEDEECKHYYFCSKAGLQYQATFKECEDPLLFDPILGKCTANYNCKKACFKKDFGPHAVIDDKTCRHYYQCKRENGIYKKMEKKCPKKTMFNKKKMECGPSYPCRNKLRVNMTTGHTFNYHLYQKTDEEIDVISKPTENHKYRVIKGRRYSPFEPTEDSESEELEEYNRCSGKADGLYRNEFDKTCKTLYKCSSQKMTKQTCPEASTFDPILHICSNRYLCPAVKSGETIIEVNVDSIMDIQMPNSSCQNKPLGPHKNVEDETCRTYYYCLLNENGMYEAEVHKCAGTSVFDGTRCSYSYSCNSVGIEDVSGLCADNELGIQANKLDVTCTSYFYCTHMKDKTILAMKNCTSPAKFNPITKVCSKDYVCDLTTSLDNTYPNEEVCDTEEPHTCTGKSFGPHADETEEDCTLFYYCVYLQDNKYKLITHKCNGTSKFDPYAGICSQDYVCSKKSVTIDLVRKEDKHICEGKSFGPHKYEYDDLCTMFYHCVDTGDGNYKVVLMKCIGNMIYDPSTKTCSSTYICPNNIHDANICQNSAYGPHRVQTDMTCKTYYYCTEDGVQPYKCEGDALFNPAEKQCTVEYICPINGIINSEPVSCAEKSIGPHADFSDKFCKRYYFCMERPDGDSEPILQACKDDFFYNPTYKNCTLDYDCDRDLFANVDTQFCESKSMGLYADPKDPTCKTYYLCKQFEVAERKICFGNTKFDPERNACFADYECPETPLLSDIIACQGKSFGPHKNETDKYCGQYYYCVNNPDGSVDLIKKQCPESYLFDTIIGACSKTIMCSYIEDENGFCGGKHVGAHRDLDDIGCSRYITCKLLNNGMFEVTYRKCPYPSSFDPEEEACVDDYKCPVNVDPITHLQISDDLCEEKEFGPHPDMYDKNCKSYYYCRKSPMGEKSVLVSQCKNNKMYDPYRQICTAKYNCPFENKNVEKCDEFTGLGPHPSKHDSECKNFYFCVQSGDTYTVRKQRCNGLENFDPINRVCSLTYACSQLIQVKDTIDSRICDSLNNLGPHADPTDKECRRYFACNRLGNTYELIGNTCQIGEVFDFEEKKCSSSKRCLKKPLREHVCRQPMERHADPTDNTCKNYYLCEFVDGAFQLKEYTCKNSEKYDPWRGICSATYKCPYEIRSIGNTEVCKDSLGPHVNRHDAECKSYLFCEYYNGNFKFREYKCKNREYFDPSINECSATYVCSHTEIAEVSNLLNECKQSGGPHVYQLDKECKTYFYCEPKGGSYKIKTRKCEGNKLFDPNLGQCSTSYICPHNTIGYPIITVDMCHAILKYYPDLYDNTCSTYYMCEFNNSTIELRQYKCKEFEAFDPKNKICSPSYKCPLEEISQETCKYMLGPYADKKDILCRGFYVCKFVDGKYELERHKCKDFKRFDPTIKKCTTSYKCPILDVEELQLPIEVVENVCSKSEGPHLNPKSKDCSSFFYCDFINDEWQVKMHRCKNSQSFNVDSKMCESNYLCLQEQISYPPKSPNTCLNQRLQTPFVDVTDKTCRGFAFCEISDDSFALRSQKCRNFETFDPVEGRCSSTHKCAFEELTTEICKYSAGPHANHNDETCKSYYFCVFNNLEYQLEEFQCKEHESFDPIENKCSETYKCNFRIVDPQEYILDEMCKMSPDLQAYPGDKTCQSYFSCKSESVSDTTGVREFCKYPQKFNPELQACDETYQCPGANIVLPDIVPEICKMSLGPHADPNDRYCTKYYFCELKGENLELVRYTCEDSKTFDPSEKICSSFYMCPYEMITPEICKYSLGPHPDPDDGRCNGFLMCEFINGAYEIRTYKCKDFETFDPNIKQCSSTYKCESLQLLTLPEEIYESSCEDNMELRAHPTDKKCVSYYKCKKNSDGFVGIEIRQCSSTEIFDPELKVCVPYEENKCIHDVIGLSDVNPIISSDVDCIEDASYVNLDDNSCSSYLKCVRAETGPLLGLKKYNCSNFETFDPSKKQCSDSYKCPYFEFSPKICEYSLGPHPDPTDKTCQHFYICEVANGLYNLVKHKCKGHASFDLEKKRCSAYYTCSYRTSLQLAEEVTPTLCRYKFEAIANHNDLKCISYFVCHVKDGAYALLPRKCSNSKKFDPYKKTCSASYKCPTDKLLKPTLSDICEEDGSTSSGPHPNLEDKSCKSYFYCKLKNSEDYSIMSHTCNDGKVFDPTNKICTYDYKCLTATTDELIESENVMKMCLNKATSGPYSLKTDKTCETYYTCSLKKGEFKIHHMSCKKGEKFDPNRKTCSSLYRCESIDNIHDDKIDQDIPDLSWKETANVLCNGKEMGPYADESDSTCTIYYICLKLNNGNYRMLTGRCENKEKYDPELRSCSHTYVCQRESNLFKPEDECSMKSTKNGSHADLMDSSCKGYYECIDGVKQYHRCPKDHRFDEVKGECVLYYVCPRIDYSISYPEEADIAKIDTLDTKTELERLQLCNDRDPYGPYENSYDPTCTEYYFCHKNVEGQYRVLSFRCFSGRMFDPKRRVCTVSYICPNKLTREIEKPEEGINIPPLDNLGKQHLIKDVCTNNDFGPHRYEQDVTCTSYYYCKNIDGKNISFLYQCEQPTMFDPEEKVCTLNYKCPYAIDQKILGPEEQSLIPESKIEFLPQLCNRKLEGPYALVERDYCSIYYYCRRDGHVVKPKIHQCKEPLKFNPDKKICTVDYDCPNKIEFTEDLPSSDMPVIDPTDYHTYINLSDMEQIKLCEKDESGPHAYEEDKTCRQYYYCIISNNGYSKMLKQQCVSPRMFDPVEKRCTVNYECPFEMPSITPEERKLQDTPADNPLIHINNVGISLPLEQQLDMCDGLSYGPHMYEDDLTCTTYYYCIQNDGIKRLLLYQCKNEFLFDPRRNVCSLDYICPTSQNQPIKVPNEDEMLELRSTLSEIEINEICEDLTWGPHVNVNDLNCTSYYYCSQNEDGKYNVAIYSCEDPYMYDPERKACRLDYNCLLKVPPTKEEVKISSVDVENICFGKLEGTAYDLKSDESCTSYYYCMRESNGVQKLFMYKCQEPYMFDDVKKVCSVDLVNKCPSKPEEAAEDIKESHEDKPIENPFNEIINDFGDTIPEEEKKNMCKGQKNGPIADKTDHSCFGFYYCLPMSEDTYKVLMFQCEHPLIFDPKKNVCSLNATCVYDVDAPIDTNVSIDIQIEEHKELQNPQLCDGKELGPHAHAIDPTCQSYYYCRNVPNLKDQMLIHRCKEPRMYHPTKQVCTTDYKCPFMFDDPIIEPTENDVVKPDVEISEVTEQEMCKNLQWGPYPIINANTCRGYYYCAERPNNRYNALIFHCKEPKVFDPYKKVCTVNYKCTDYIDESLFKTKFESISKPEVHLRNPMDELIKDINIPEEESIELCKNRMFGPHAKNDDTTCSLYYYCKNSKDKAPIALLYQCDFPQMYNPDKKICTTHYICPLDESYVPEEHVEDVKLINPLVKIENPLGKSLSYIEVNRLCEGRVSGPYADEKDETCSTYYYCENELVFMYRCNDSLMFDPEKMLCTSKYRCPHKVDVLIEPITISGVENVRELTDIEKYQMCKEYKSKAVAYKEDKTCSQYYYCSEDEDGNTNIFLHSCKLPRKFDPVQQICSIGYECPYKVDKNIVYPSDVTTLNGNANITNLEKVQMCDGKEMGPYADEEDPTCSSYYYCRKNGAEYNVLLYRCTEPYMFHPTKMKCSANYKCKHRFVSLQDNIIKLPVNPFDEIIEDSIVTPEEKYILCHSKTPFTLNADKNDTTCRKYYSCAESNNKYKIFIEECEEPRMFDPDKKVCSVHYNCIYKPESVLTEEVKALEDVVVKNPIDKVLNNQELSLPEDIALVMCKARDIGPHLYNRDPKFKSYYYYCLKISPTDYRVFVNNCQSPKRFDEKLRVCFGKDIPVRKDINIEEPELVELSATPLTEKEKGILCFDKGVGPHADPEDPDCRRYYFCKYLNSVTLNVLFNSCEEPRVFDPKSKTCTIKYKCPYEEYKKPEVADPEVVDPIDPLFELSTDGDQIVDDHINELCDGIGWGPFTDTENGECRSYYYCKKRKHGYKLLKYYCEPPLMYNQSTKTCTVHHDCPYDESVIPDIDDVTIIDPFDEIVNPPGESITEEEKQVRCEGREWGPHAHDSDPTCSIYYYCKNEDDKANKIFIFRCPETYSFDPELKICSRYKCPFRKDEPIVQPHPLDNNIFGDLIDPSEKYILCNDREWGPHPKEDDPTCRQYYYCKKNDKEHKTLMFRCKEPRTFDPVNQVCSIYHNCVERTYINEINSPIRDPLNQIKNPGLQIPEDKKLDMCEGKQWGPHADMSDRTCKSYYFCNKNEVGKYKVFTYTCKHPEMMFDPVQKYCRKNYNCIFEPPVSFTGIPDVSDLIYDPLYEIENTLEGNFTPLERYKICNGKEWGPHALIHDTSCSSYYYCKKNIRDNYDVIVIPCPQYQMYDPEEGMCSVNYVCPYYSSISHPEVTEEPCDDNADVIVELGSPKHEDPNSFVSISSEDSDIPVVRIPPEPTPKCGEELYKVDYNCTEKGYHSNKHDQSCRSYIFCDAVEDGNIFPHGLVCPRGYLFNPETKQCSNTYQCF